LFFSLLLFASECLAKGINRGIEVGSGTGYGGLNHVEVGKTLNEKFTLTMYDPMASAGKVISDNLHMVIFQEAVTISQIFPDPVFSDIFENHNWDMVQRSFVAPFVMYKRIYRGKQRRVGMIIQPFHTEVRELRGYAMFHDLVIAMLRESRFFCRCRDCALFKFLAQKYAIDEARIFYSLVRLGYQPHVYVQGFGNISHRVDKTGNLADLGLRISQGVSAVVDGKEISGFFPPSPITRKRLQDTKKRGQVMAQNAAIVRREGIAHIVQQFYQDIGGVSLYYGKKFDYEEDFKLIRFLGFQFDYVYDNVIFTMPWAKDMCLFIDKIQLGNHFGFCFPLLLDVRRQLKIALNKSGFDSVLMRTGVRDTVMLFVRNVNGVSFTFYFPGIKTYVPRIEGSGNVYGNEQTSVDAFSETEDETIDDCEEDDYRPRLKVCDPIVSAKRREDALRMRRYRDRLKKGENFTNMRKKIQSSKSPKLYKTNLLSSSSTKTAKRYNKNLEKGSVLYNSSIGFELIINKFPKMSILGRCAIEKLYESKKNFDISSIDGSDYSIFLNNKFYFFINQYDIFIYNRDWREIV